VRGNSSHLSDSRRHCSLLGNPGFDESVKDSIGNSHDRLVSSLLFAVLFSVMKVQEDGLSAPGYCFALKQITPLLPILLH